MQQQGFPQLNFYYLYPRLSVKSEKVKENMILHHLPKSLCHCCKNQWREQSFFITYPENRGLAIDAFGDREQ